MNDWFYQGPVAAQETSAADPSPEDLDRLFQKGVLRDLTPEQALSIQDYRKSRRTVDAALSAVPGALGQAAKDLGGGLMATGRLVAEGRPMKVADSMAEGALRGTADFGKMETDVLRGLVVDPIRVKLMGRDPGEVAKERLIADRKWAQDREAMRTGDEPGHFQDLVTVAANALPFIDESLAVKIGQALAGDMDVAEAASYVASLDALAPGLHQVATGTRAAKVARAMEAADKVRMPHLAAVPGVEVMTPTGALPKAMEAVAEAAKPSRGLGQRAIAAGASGMEGAAKRVAEVAGRVAEHTPALRGAGAAAGLLHGPMGSLVGYRLPEAIHLTGKAASGVGGGAGAIRRLAQADWESRVPVWMQLAKDAEAPAWLKRVASSKAAPAIERSMRAGKASAVGAAQGAAIGGGLMALDPTKTGEEIGGGAATGMAMGAGGGLVGHIASRKERMALAGAYDRFRYVDQAIQNGVDPLVALNTPDAVLDTAVALETLFKGAFSGGRDLAIRLASPDEDGLRGGQVASFDPTSNTVTLNVGARDADGRLLHESIGHGLMASVVASNPNIIATVAGHLTPEALERAKYDYARAMGHEGDLARAYVAQQDSQNPYWIHSEIFAEGAAHELRGQDLLAATPTVLGRRGRQTFFRDPEVRDVVASPQMAALVRNEFEVLRQFRPGLDEGVERGQVMNTGMAGAHPALPVEALPDGTRGNDFVQMTPDGRAIQRPQKEVRRRVRSRQQEMARFFPDTAPVSWEAGPEVRTRQTPSGLVRKTGTKLPEKWYRESGTFSEGTKMLARAVEAAIEGGSALAGWYQQVIPRVRAEIRDTLGGMEAQFKDFMPFAFTVDGRNNVLVMNYSLTALERKINEWAQRSGLFSLDLWNGDRAAFRQDVQTYLANHAEGRAGADGGLGERKRDLINAFLLGDNRTFGEFNPLRDRLMGADKTGVVRSYRLDRLQTVEESQLTGYRQGNYTKQLNNLSPDVEGRPEGQKQVPDNERLKDSVPGSQFRVDPQAGGLRFHDGIQRTARDHKLGKAVEVKDAGFYTDPKNALFLSDDGNAGVAVTDYGDLVSVFKHPDSRENIRPLLEDAAAISTTLDAFDVGGFLPTLYAKFGFKPVARVKFSREYAPEGWPYDLAGEPDVVLMVKDWNKVLPEVDEVYGNVRESIPLFEDYGEAAALQAAAKKQVVDSGLPGHVRHSPPVADLPAPDPATLPAYFVRGANGKVKLDKKTHQPSVVAEDYAFLRSPLVEGILDSEPDPKAARDLLFGRGGIISILNTAHLDARKPFSPEQQAVYDKIVDAYSDAAEFDFRRWTSNQDVMDAIGWYSHVADKVRGIIPDQKDRHTFLEFLGGTSPNTSVEQNFLYAIDLFNRWKSGELQEHVGIYNRVREEHAAGEFIPRYLEESAESIKARERNPKKPIKYKWKSLKDRAQFVADFAKMSAGEGAGPKKLKSETVKARQRAANPTRADLLAWRMFVEGAYPVRKNGGKYGVHTDRIFQIMAGTWEQETPAPKAPNFTGNLKGTRRTATIDVWAARFLRRLGYELPGAGPWRIQPKAETGVGNSDFFFGQDVFAATVEKIGDRLGIRMQPDDLQAVMWFAEKMEWERRGWSKAADLGDFRDYLYKMRQDPDTGHLALEDATLGSTSQGFFDSLKFPAKDVRLPSEEVPTRLSRSKKRLVNARKELAGASSKTESDKIQKRIQMITKEITQLEQQLEAEGPAKVLQTRGYE